MTPHAYAQFCLMYTWRYAHTMHTQCMHSTHIYTYPDIQTKTAQETVAMHSPLPSIAECHWQPEGRADRLVDDRFAASVGHCSAVAPCAHHFLRGGMWGFSAQTLHCQHFSPFSHWVIGGIYGEDHVSFLVIVWLVVYGWGAEQDTPLNCQQLKFVYVFNVRSSMGQNWTCVGETKFSSVSVRIFTYLVIVWWCRYVGNRCSRLL